MLAFNNRMTEGFCTALKELHNNILRIFEKYAYMYVKVE